MRPLTMVEKLSSARTMSEASLATSVPAMPMATPMSASFSAGRHSPHRPSWRPPAHPPQMVSETSPPDRSSSRRFTIAM